MALIPTLALAAAALGAAPPPQAPPALASIGAPRRVNLEPAMPAVRGRLASPPGLTVIGYSLDNSLIVRSPSPAAARLADSVRVVEIPLPGGRMVVTLRRAAPDAARGGALALSPAGEPRALDAWALCLAGARRWLAQVCDLLGCAELAPGRLFDDLLEPAPPCLDPPLAGP